MFNPTKIKTMDWKKKIERIIAGYLPEQSFNDLAQEIVDQSYPKEFVEFLRLECEGFNNGWKYYKTMSPNDDIYFETTTDIFRYWSDEVDKG